MVSAFRVESSNLAYLNTFQCCADESCLKQNSAPKQATDYLRHYCASSFTVEPPYEDWEVELH
ncbi:DUF7677 family protein [Pectobacterium carotovorum]|uniref:DUF7677 family protein n=1 Tax=Pectobacterium carotovorum TaxID=554 RepID=UPI003AFABAB8